MENDFFFFNKGEYLNDRYYKIIKELEKRGITPV